MGIGGGAMQVKELKVLLLHHERCATIARDGFSESMVRPSLLLD
jgi:hypothetical protein